jgi:hypothetical protein
MDEDSLCKLGFLLSEATSLKLFDLAQLSDTDPFTIVSDAIDTMWNHHFKKRRIE